MVPGSQVASWLVIRMSVWAGGWVDRRSGGQTHEWVNG